MHFIDAHTHAHFAAFKDDWKDVIGRALSGDVWVVNVGTQMDTSRRAVSIAGEYDEGVYATVGLHPVHTNPSYHDSDELGGGTGFTSRGEVFDYDAYKELTADPKVVGIGECGFDYFRLEGDEEEIWEKQKAAFLSQIELSEETGKPIMIHCRSGERRDAFADLIEALRPHVDNIPPGIVHFFSGTEENARELCDMGFSFTFGGVVTFTGDYDAVVKMLPSDRILSETDAPYVTPAPYRGRRNEPLYVREVVSRLAELRGVSPEKMKETIWQNARRVFKI